MTSQQNILNFSLRHVRTREKASKRPPDGRLTTTHGLVYGCKHSLVGMICQNKFGDHLRDVQGHATKNGRVFGHDSGGSTERCSPSELARARQCQRWNRQAFHRPMLHLWQERPSTVRFLVQRRQILDTHDVKQRSRDRQATEGNPTQRCGFEEFERSHGIHSNQDPERQKGSEFNWPNQRDPRVSGKRLSL